MTALELPIRQSPRAHSGRALARIPADAMGRLGLEPGDPVAIEMGRLTHCRAIPAPTGGEAIEVDAQVAERIGGDWGNLARLERVELPALASAIVTTNMQSRPEDIAEALFDLPLTEGDDLQVALPMGRHVHIHVTETDPSPAGLFTDATLLSIAGHPATTQLYEGIGGLDEQVARVHEMVATPLQRPDLFERLGIAPPRGILFTGPPGSGKTLLARAVAARTEAAFFHINGPEIVSKHYGDSEAALRRVFDAATREAPAIVFIDEIDAVAPRRDTLSGEKQVERRIVAQLLTLMDGLSDRGRLVVMAATNLPDALDPALRRPGRFDREIAFQPPTREERWQILQVHLGASPLDPDADLDAIVEASHGYVGADLAALVREAGLAALARNVREAGGENRVRAEDVSLIQADLDHGLAVTRPSVLRDLVTESPTVQWADIGGLDDVKATLQEAVVWPVAHREAFRRLRVPPARGVLLSGPPGSGKTLLARALASQSGMNFVGVRPTRILSQFLGEAERAVAELFAKARHAAPALLFFDEFDTLSVRRGSRDASLDRIVTQFLVEMDGLADNDGVTVLAATNRAAAIDPALLRPGRFDLVVPVPLPDQEARLAILTVHLAGRPVSQSVDLDQLAVATEGASGADLAALVELAARSALRRGLTTSEPSELSAADFDTAHEALSCQSEERAADYVSHIEVRQ